MIAAPTGVAAALSQDYPQYSLLCDFESDVPGLATYRLTDAPRTITINGNIYSPSKEILNEVSLPVDRLELNRSEMEISIIDVDRVWFTRMQRISEYIFSLRMIFNADKLNPSFPLLLYRGYGAGLSYESGQQNPFTLILTFTGPLRNSKGDFTAVTSDSNQRTRDPNDNSFSSVGVLRDFSWGGR